VPEELDRLFQVLGHRFANPDLLREALTHPSVERPKRRAAPNYQRLEFLGDRVLGLVVAEHLFQRFPTAPAGELALRYNALVRRDSLVRVAEAIDLGRHVVLSKSERASSGASKPAILADVCEAVIAALYLDAGIETARRFIAAMWEPIVAEITGAEKDPKTTLQEWAHAAGLAPPRYETTGQEGPPHAPLFAVTVHLDGLPPAAASGRSKREAEQAAAAIMLAAGASHKRGHHG